jgi:serine/threonine-protein kinase
VAWIESSTMTQVGARIGTPAYMSPEQYQGLPISGRSDLFSAGVILYQFLTGERPFTGGGYPLIQQILLQDPVPPSEINGDIPRAVDAVTIKALAKRPEDRFATAREFAEAFRMAATGESAEASIALLLNDGALPVNGRSAISQPGFGRGTTTAGASATGGDSDLANVSLAAELEYWKEIKDSTEAVDFETFLQVFPQSRFAPLARRRMNRLETEPNGTREADAQRQHEDTERARIEAEQAVIDAAEEEARRAADLRLQRLDAKEPKLVFPLAGEAHEVASAMDFSPGMMVQPAFDTVGNAPFRSAGEPIHARRRAGRSAQTPPGPGRAHSSASSPWQKLPRLPLALALAAALVGGVTWYAAARPELAPMFATLNSATQALLAQLDQRWQARDGQQAQQQSTGGEATRLAEEQRKREEALKAERNRQQALAQQKVEAARAAADQDYERARALLNQGRSSEAVRLLRQLAHDGHGPAAKTLGDLYSRGEDVLLDMQEAARFYAIAERNGVKLDRPAFVRR